MDMDISTLRSPNYLFSCELKVDRNYHFNLGTGKKGELHIVEAGEMNYEGSPIKITLTTLKMSIQPTISLGGFEITLPVVSHSNGGSQTGHVGGKHLVAVEEDVELEDTAEEDVKLLSISGKMFYVWEMVTSFHRKESNLLLMKGSLGGAADDNEDGDDDLEDNETEEKASSCRDIKAKMQAGIEKDPFLPKVEAKFINYMKNCFQMTDQEAIQDL
ncbi:unnamed protein product [Nyctereutes procyonoides]|uniref:Nucleophosmin n=1 Tax=Nyctereutes procyonoides TaxID=34880 RepID=A0A811Y2D3_NYCPR|nr:unnamed protein product [Nyctereutes procyonoides]